MKEVIYNPAFMKVNEIQLTRNESRILNELLAKDILSSAEITKAMGSKAVTRSNAVTILRLRKKVGHLISIINERNSGYYVENKERIKIKDGSLVKQIKFLEYRQNLEEYLDKVFEEFKMEVDEAETRLRERLGKIL